MLLHPPHDVQIGHARLDHHHVGALGQVQGDLPQGLVRVAGVHLVAVLVAGPEARLRAHGVAKRAVVAGRVLRRVRQDAGVAVPGALQGVPDLADPAVHHVRRGDHVGARVRVGQGLAHQHLDGLVVQDVAGVVDEAVLAVGGEGVERHVGDDPEFGKACLQGTHGALGETFRIEGLAGVQGLAVPGGDREQGDGRHPEAQELLGLAQEPVDGEALHPRHRLDGLPSPLALEHEIGCDQVVGGDPCLAHQPAGEVVTAHPPHPRARIASGESVHAQCSGICSRRGCRWPRRAAGCFTNWG